MCIKMYRSSEENAYKNKPSFSDTQNIKNDKKGTH